VRAVFIVEKNADSHFSELISSMFDSFQIMTSSQDVISMIYMDPPDLILIDGSYLLTKGGGIVREFRSNTIFGNIPIVALLEKGSLEHVSSSTTWTSPSGGGSNSLRSAL
jgi:DNA-binding response OmpR family regulator